MNADEREHADKQDGGWSNLPLKIRKQRATKSNGVVRSAGMVPPVRIHEVVRARKSHAVENNDITTPQRNPSVAGETPGTSSTIMRKRQKVRATKSGLDVAMFPTPTTPGASIESEPIVKSRAKKTLAVLEKRRKEQNSSNVQQDSSLPPKETAQKKKKSVVKKRTYGSARLKNASSPRRVQSVRAKRSPTRSIASSKQEKKRKRTSSTTIVIATSESEDDDDVGIYNDPVDTTPNPTMAAVDSDAEMLETSVSRDARKLVTNVCKEVNRDTITKEDSLLLQETKTDQQTALAVRDAASGTRKLKLTTPRPPGKSKKYRLIKVSFERGNHKRLAVSQKIVRFSKTEPREPAFSLWVPVSQSFWTQDDEELTALPYLNNQDSIDDDKNNAILQGFETSKRERMMEYGSIANQKKVDEKIDAILARLNEEKGDVATMLPSVAKCIREPCHRVKERYNMMMNPIATPEFTYLNSYRDIWCGQCCTYDCNRHGLRPEIIPKAEEMRSLVMLEREREKKPNASLTLAPKEESEMGNSLTDQQKVMFDDVWQMYEGDVEKVARFLRVTVAVASSHAETVGATVLASKGATKMVNDTPSSKQYYSLQHYKWYKGYGEATKRAEFKPCYHEGECSDTNCQCVQNKHFCTRDCVWGMPGNRNFFRGCKCDGKCLQRNCSCFGSQRECDPSLCRCGCFRLPPGQIASGDDVRNDNMLMSRAPNLGVSQSTLPSAGYGCFTLGALRKGDYIGEFIGELISPEDADRRGAIADANKLSYLFEITSDSVVDASRFGNITRFINDSGNPNTDTRGKLRFVVGVVAWTEILCAAPISFLRKR